YFGVDKSALVDLTTFLKLTFTPVGPLSNYVSAYGHLSWAKILDSELADMWEDDSNFWFGIGLNFFHQAGGGE
ncbi:hypothetical protein KKA08_08940, partial [bacterium]|nr:hypothetical protein [bacterium]